MYFINHNIFIVYYNLIIVLPLISYFQKRKGPGWDGYHPAQHSGNHIWQQPRSHTNHPTVAKEPGAGPKLIYITYYSQ